MHIFGMFYTNLQGIQMIECLSINAVFNTGVTCFVLISGYFGIKRDWTKIIKMIIMTFIYSFSTYIILVYTKTVEFEWLSLIKSILPVVSSKYWFITCYIILSALAPYINQFAEKIDKKLFIKLITTLLIIFSIIPTFMYFDITNDSGKGIINMTLAYLIGRYIGLYHKNDTIDKKRIGIILAISILCTFLVNGIVSMISGHVTLGIWFKDSAFFVIISAICIFLLFKTMTVKNKVINILAKNVLYIYILDSFIRKIINRVFDISPYINKWYIIFIVFMYALVVCMIAIIISYLVELILGKLIKKISRFIYNHMCNIAVKIRRVLDKYKLLYIFQN